MLSHPPKRVPELVWRPVQKAAQLMCQVQEIAAHMAHQVLDIAKLVLRTLDGVTLQTTRVRTRSQMEWVYGPLTFSIASGVLFARPGGEVPA